jgi:hypothetical protein
VWAAIKQMKKIDVDMTVPLTDPAGYKVIKK